MNEVKGLQNSSWRRLIRVYFWADHERKGWLPSDQVEHLDCSCSSVLLLSARWPGVSSSGGLTTIPNDKYLQHAGGSLQSSGVQWASCPIWSLLSPDKAMLGLSLGLNWSTLSKSRRTGLNKNTVQFSNKWEWAKLQQSAMKLMPCIPVNQESVNYHVSLFWGGYNVI